MNKNYVNGRAKEYRIMKKLKEEGYEIVFRSAGSHSCIDVIAISKTLKKIKLIQSKPKKFSLKQATAIRDCLDWLNNEFMVEFHLLSNIQELKGGE